MNESVHAATISVAVERLAGAFVSHRRSPVLRSPADHGLTFESVIFPSQDGIELKGWFVPADNARAVVVVNHPRYFSRSGLPAHQEPWRSSFAVTGNDFEVDLVPDIAILHRAGYHVLAYDLRNFGSSATADDAVTSGGILESRDVIGSLRYIRSRPDCRGADIVLFSRCLGANASLFAIQRAPAEFADVRGLVACQPLSPHMVLERALEREDLPLDLMHAIDERTHARTGFRLAEMSPIPAASSCSIPTFVYQVREDRMTRQSDVQAVFEALPDAGGDNELYWIEDTSRRWDGYLYFQRDPSHILEWIRRHVG
ncbi:alpha/beta fold hydrolase [Tsukamurella sp. 8F]|uniref:alpha/beta hydrolase family protein n=1 Tax=unclassified Tsukamurella TaxID=2633480 RepID=UPI0023B98D08|nr:MULTISPECIES: alpha/beta fold hydrolase [unclassified Tsukamurella]MDF0529359.1 alpha/beta fold hydrolase [Tsukamurella sp. 8J]MDF0587134.1 alpha/beta fold hydrolase [Tsukamurella sp. 8F]